MISGRIGVDGNSLDKPIASPNIRGHGFVGTPNATPYLDGSETPLMTWGELEGTPFRLDGSDTPVRPSMGPSFRIHETSRRENIAMELAEKAGKRIRDSKSKALEAAKHNMSSPYIRSSLDRLNTMSPAAKRLASSSLGLRDSLLSPSPRASPASTFTPSPLVKKKKSHDIGISSKHKKSSASGKKRSSAADFF